MEALNRREAVIESGGQRCSVDAGLLSLELRRRSCRSIHSFSMPVKPWNA